VSRSGAISTSSIDSAINPPAASTPRLCQTTPPAPTRATFAPTLPSAKLSSTSISPYTSPSSSDLISVCYDYGLMLCLPTHLLMPQIGLGSPHI
jgi:hypothetical protein